MVDNRKAFNDGMKVAKRLLDNHIAGIFSKICRTVIHQALEHLDLPGMTGNARRSFAAGVYVNGVLMYDTLSADDWHDALAPKLQEGDKFRAGRKRHDGNVQQYTFTADVDTDGDLAERDAKLFLATYKPKSKGIEAVVCSGAEYISFVETIKGVDAMTYLLMEMPLIADACITKIS